MKHRPALLLIACLLASVFLFGCKSEPVTRNLNSVLEFYSDGNRLEATVRELTIDGDDASVRFRVVNRGESEIPSLKLSVRFLDASGSELYTDDVSASFAPPLAVGDSKSITADCSGERVGEIERISIASAE